MSQGGYRVISGLRWAKKVDRPEGMKKGRPRGAKRLGLQYEAQIARALPEFIHGQWFEFEDRWGHGFCQTDLIDLIKGTIIEAKLSWKPEAYCQLEFLYRPVVEFVLQMEISAIIVTKRLTSGMKLPDHYGRDLAICHDLDSAIEKSKPGREVVVHWLGTTPLHRGLKQRPLRRVA